MNKNHPRKGVKHTELARKKMSENHADFTGTANPFYGKTHSQAIRESFKMLYSKIWVITFPDGSSQKFVGRKEVIQFVKNYNEQNNSKVSAHSLFQYGRNKHGWVIREVVESGQSK